MAYIGKQPGIEVVSVNDLNDINTDNPSQGEILIYDSASGAYTSQSGQTFLGTYSTADLPEGSNLYYTTVRFDSDLQSATSIAAIRGYVSADGDLTYDSSTGIFSINVETVYTTANFDSDFNLSLDAAALNGTGLSYDSATNTLSITDTGVVPGTYGSSSTIPVFTVNAQGQIDSIGEASVAGVTGFAYDSASSTFTISTATGDSFGAVFTLDQYSTTDIAEGDNLYYTTARADSDVGNYLVSNSYATQAYVDSEINAVLDGAPAALDTLNELAAAINDDANFASSVTNSLGNKLNTADFDSAFDTRLATKSTSDIQEDGNLYYTKVRVDSDIAQGFSSRSTTDLDEGNNLYYTKVRVDSDVAQGFNDRSTSDVTEGSNLYYTKARVDSDVAQGFTDRTTSDVAEGSNLYYTTARFDSDLTSAINTDSAVTQTIRDYFSAAGDINYEPTTGQFSLDVEVAYTKANFDSDFNASLDEASLGGAGLVYNVATNTLGIDSAELASYFNTNDITEGDNLYYTTSRADSDFDQRLDTKSTNDVTEGDNLYYTTARADSDFDNRLATKSTTDVTEGNNLYYTTARADSDAKNAVSATDNGGDGSFSYDAGTGTFSYTGPSASETRAHFSGGTGVTLNAGEISIGQAVSTTSNVTFNNINANEISTGLLTADSASLGGINLTIQSTPYDTAAGTLFFDSNPSKALSFVTRTDEGAEDVTINVGQEEVVYVKNTTGANIENGSVVRFGGADPDGNPLAIKAISSQSIEGRIGIATQLIPNGGHGYVTTQGIVRDVNTGGMTTGQSLYVSKDSAGVFTNVAVSIDNGYPFHVGTVLDADPTAGSIFVAPYREHFEYLRIEDRMRVDGKIMVDSAVTDNVSTNYIDFTPADPGPDQVEGRVYYNDEYKALTVYNDISGSSLQVGHEDWTRVYNNSGSPIPDGTPVYVTGASGETLTVAPADATTEAKAQVIGIATHTIPDNSEGVITIRGLMSGLDTSGLTPGGRVHLSSAGGLTPSAQTYPYFPVDLGTCVVQDSNNGYIYVNIIEHHAEAFRVTGNTRMDGNLTVDGDLTVNGTQSVVSQANLAVDNSFVYLNSGNTIGEDNTNFTGSGLDDAYFTGHYNGTTTKNFYVRIDGVGTGTGGVDTFEWSLDDFSSTEATGVDITGSNQSLSDGISILFNATTGHTSGDKWDGQAAPTNVDTGWFSNRNTGASGVGYTHLGIFYDVSDNKYKAIDAYAPEPNGTIDTQDSSFSLGTFVASEFEGNLTGNVTGSLTGNASSASKLDSASRISLAGDLTGSVTFDGSQNVILTADYAAQSITNTDISNVAGIADTKLATISTSGKVENSATTATDSNIGSTIVSRDPVGNFTAGIITANLTGNVTGNLTGNVTGQVSRLDNWNTDNLLEGDSNLYYEKTRVDSDVAQGFTDRSTSDLSEGTNLYYTKVRVDSDVAQGFTDRSTTNLTEGDNLYYTKARVDSDFDYNLSNKSTNDLAEGDNLYYTTARHDSDFAYSLSNESTTSLSEGDNLYYTKARVDSDVAQGFTDRSTSNLTEGTNLYYTKVRVDSDVAQGFTDRTTTNLAEGNNLYYTTARSDSDIGAYISTNSIATQTYVDNSISAVLDNAPAALDTLNELAAAINDDSNFAGTVTANLATKLNITAFDSAFDTALSGKSTTNLTEGDNLYYTLARVDSDVRNGVGALDNGGDGSLTYNNSTGIFTYTGPSASEVRAHFSEGTGIDIASGQISIDLAEITTSTSNADGDFFLVVDDANNQKKLTKANINISGFNNDAGFYDSADVVSSINTHVNKTFVESLGIDAGLDSAAVTNLVDSDYVATRAPSGVTTGKAIAMAIVFG